MSFFFAAAEAEAEAEAGAEAEAERGGCQKTSLGKTKGTRIMGNGFKTHVVPQNPNIVYPVHLSRPHPKAASVCE